MTRSRKGAHYIFEIVAKWIMYHLNFLLLLALLFHFLHFPFILAPTALNFQLKPVFPNSSLFQTPDIEESELI
jgi:hypothetical protein